MASVADLYTQVLGRAPDAAGLAYWESMFGSTVDPAELATFKSVAAVTEPTAVAPTAAPAPDPNFVDPGLWRNVDTVNAASQPVTPSTAVAAPKTVNDLYQTFYGTPGDASGLSYWGGADKAVTPKDAASWLLWAGKDPSIANKSTGLTVDQAYETYLGFKPDETARNYWTGGDPNKPLTTAELAAITSEAYGLNKKDGNGLFGSGIGPDVGWVNLRDNLEAAGVVAGNYFLPGSSMLTSQLVTEGAKEALATDVGKVANIAAGAAGGIQGNAANYGKLGEAAGITGPAAGAAPTAGALDAQFVAADAAQLAQQGLSQAAIEQNLLAAGVDAFTAADAAQLALQGIKGGQLEGLLTQSAGGNPIFSGAGGVTGSTTGGTTAGTPTTNTNPLTNLTPDQVTTLAKAGINVAGILGAGAAVKGITNNLTGTGGGGMLTQQDRSGISSGSAQYSPEYYQAIQAKYNQMMPAQPRDVTTDLKSWYETKYAPKVTQ